MLYADIKSFILKTAAVTMHISFAPHLSMVQRVQKIFAIKREAGRFFAFLARWPHVWHAN